MREVQAIKRSIIIAVEGKDYFFSILSQIDGPAEFENVQLWDFCEGGQGFAQWLRSFRTLRNFASVRSVAVIRDAEGNAAGTFHSLQQAFLQCEMVVPLHNNTTVDGHPRTGILVVPHDKQEGCLENAIIEAALSSDHLKCADTFLACVNDPDRNDNWRAKVRVHSIIAASSNPAATLGQSHNLSLWDFSHPSLSVMIDFIRRCAAE